MLRTITLLTLIFSGTLHAQDPVAQILTVHPDGTITPTGVVATVQQIAKVTSDTLLVSAKADAAAHAANLVSNAVAGVTEIINSLEGIGYIRGYVTQFGAGMQADTNTTANIIKIARLDPAPDGDSLWETYTYFSSNPGNDPIIRYSRTLSGDTTSWDAAPTLGPPTIEEVEVKGVIYEAYRHVIKLPPEYATVFWRVYVDLAGSGAEQEVFPVNIGISVNGREPLTGTFVIDGITYAYEGGIRVQTD